jgi:hypothetical protein
MPPHRLPRDVLQRTFQHFRACGQGRRECQALWLSSWSEPSLITEVVHPKHQAHLAGFVMDDRWLSAFLFRLAEENLGIPVQVHTHPAAAFHSPTDDAYPIVHKPGFLSLVIPDFALGPVGFERAYLTEIQGDGTWRQVPIRERLQIV